VFTIAHRRLLDAARARRRRPVTPLSPERLRPLAEALEGPVDGMQGTIDRLVDQDLLAGLLAHLNGEQREVLLLRFAADLDTTTVGEVTGRSANAVAAITRRGLVALRGVIEEQGFH
jgi:RNA polymerase sigma-70 factor (ECF subfamily)